MKCNGQFWIVELTIIVKSQSCSNQTHEINLERKEDAFIKSLGVRSASLDDPNI